MPHKVAWGSHCDWQWSTVEACLALTLLLTFQVDAIIFLAKVRSLSPCNIFLGNVQLQTTMFYLVMLALMQCRCSNIFESSGSRLSLNQRPVICLLKRSYYISNICHLNFEKNHISITTGFSNMNKYLTSCDCMVAVWKLKCQLKQKFL